MKIHKRKTEIQSYPCDKFIYTTVNKAVTVDKFSEGNYFIFIKNVLRLLIILYEFDH